MRSCLSTIIICLSTFLIAIVLALSGCGSRYAVETDYDQEYDFANAAGTFTWLPQRETKEPMVDELTATRIVNALEAGLATKGITPAPAGSEAHIGLRYYVVVVERMDVQTFSSGVGYYDNWYGINSGSTRTVTTPYQRGTLVLDIVDKDQDRLIWRGNVSTRLKEDRSPSERDQIVADAVAALLAEFPPAK
ncbi:MAG: DUF4136 domain-containing protein [Planctomycetota bacterium]|jgi:hypothetical protein|nr:DUF4136 domain-containing protein [Planctomycetota bacterium]